jgi:hypothetical protein
VSAARLCDHSAVALGGRTHAWLVAAAAIGWMLGAEASTGHAQAAPVTASRAAEDDREEAAPSFGAVATVERAEPQTRATTAEETRRLHTSLGPSFHLVEAMPGTVPVFSGVPYMLVRGAPPSGTAQLYDGMPVPALFHVALGPMITHPSLVGALSLYPGVAPARYGRHTGAVLVADGPRPTTEPGGAIELRLLDAQGLLRAPELGVDAHVRYGYHDVMLDLIGSNAVLSAWDYHLRVSRPAGPGAALTVTALGVGDQLGDRADRDDDIALQFHRVRAAFERALAHGETGAAVYAGWERGVLGGELTATQWRVGPATFLELRRPDGARARLGVEMEARLSSIERSSLDGATVAADPPTGMLGPDAFLPDQPGGIDLQSGPEDVIDRTPLADRPARSTLSAYAELGLAPPGSRLSLDAGARADLYVVAGEPEQSFDPRLVLRFQALDALWLHAGFGTAHQGAISPIPIAGLADLELDHGLQSALQGEAGAKLELPESFSASVTGFAHELRHVVYLELILDCEGNSDPLAPLLFNTAGNARERPLCESSGLPRGRGRAYGVELLVRRELRERFAGWVSYTLAWAEARAQDGTEFVPQSDVRHVANAVLTQSWGAGFHSGARAHYRSGKPAVNTFFDFTQGAFHRTHTRLPPFFRLDLQLSREFEVSFGRLVASLELQNVTFSREAVKRDCRLDAALEVVCEVDHAPAIVLPNAGLRAEF